MIQSPQSEATAGLPCTAKLAFDTQKQAQTAAVVAEYQYGAKMKAYHCQHCGLWHLSTTIEE